MAGRGMAPTATMQLTRSRTSSGCCRRRACCPRRRSRTIRRSAWPRRASRTESDCWPACKCDHLLRGSAAAASGGEGLHRAVAVGVVAPAPLVARVLHRRIQPRRSRHQRSSVVTVGPRAHRRGHPAPMGRKSVHCLPTCAESFPGTPSGRVWKLHSRFLFLLLHFSF
jgi:hypothetical protein